MNKCLRTLCSFFSFSKYKNASISDVSADNFPQVNQQKKSRFATFFNKKVSSKISSNHILIPLQEPSNLIHKIASRKGELLAKSFLQLHKNDNDEWQLTGSDGKKTKPSGDYGFVTLLNENFIRVAPLNKSVHLVLSEGAENINYAGEVYFNAQGELLFFNNQSGAYKPPSHLCAQSGFPPACFRSFMPHESANRTYLSSNNPSISL